MGRGQLLSTNERIMKYQDDTGHKKTPSVLRFLQAPKFEENIVRKVLHKEINQEYSAILQCFRHFIKTDYLTKSIHDSTETVIDNQHNEVHQNNDNILPSESAFDLHQIKMDERLMEQEEEEDEELDI